MLDEDTVIKTFRNNNEQLLLLNIICVIVLPTILFGTSSELLAGMFISLGIVAPINICKYIYSWSPRPIVPMKFFALCVLPFVASMIITIIGMNNGGLTSVTIGDNSYFTLSDTSTISPMNAYVHPLAPITGELVSLAAFLAGFSIFMITDSRFVVRKILLSTATTIAIITILGIAVNFIGNFEQSPYANSFKYSFSTFVDASQWASFAIIWIGASFAMALYSGQRFRSLPFVNSIRFFGISLAIILLLGVLCAGKPIHQFFALLISTISMILLAFDVAPIKKNVRRHEMLRHISSHSLRLKKMRLPCAIYTLLALVAFCGIIMVTSEIKNNPSMLVVDNTKNSITYAEKSALWEDAIQMVDEKHLLFGYGTASFANVFALNQGSDLDSVWTSPQSDLLHKIFENGIVGLILSSLTFVFMTLRWLLKRKFSASGAIMMISIVAILLISTVEIPFQSIAVLSSFWVLAMSLFRWDDAKVG